MSFWTFSYKKAEISAFLFKINLLSGVSIAGYELILAIKAFYDGLITLDVRPERITLHGVSLEKLEQEFEAVGDQLKTRKRFLGVK